MEICFLTCICIWQISLIQTCLCVCWTWICLESPAFMRSSTSHPAGSHGRLAPKRKIEPALLGAGGFDTIYTAVCDRCDISTACRLCRLEPFESSSHVVFKSSSHLYLNPRHKLYSNPHHMLYLNLCHMLC